MTIPDDISSVPEKVEPLGGKLAEAWRLSTGWGAARLVNKAPHINAATVFVNWLLSKEAPLPCINFPTHLRSSRFSAH